MNTCTTQWLLLNNFQEEATTYSWLQSLSRLACVLWQIWKERALIMLPNQRRLAKFLTNFVSQLNTCYVLSIWEHLTRKTKGWARTSPNKQFQDKAQRIARITKKKLNKEYKPRADSKETRLKMIPIVFDRKIY